MKTCALSILVMVVGTVCPGFAQSQAPETHAPAAQTPAAAAPYKPKFPGDPARSEAEAGALGYMRVVLRAQREYKKRHDHFAESLPALAGTGTFTKRMARSTDRGDYTVEFHGKKDNFTLAMVPKQYDDQHRAFFAEENGVIHVEEGRPATAESPRLK
jgi:hypothetical protein